MRTAQPSHGNQRVKVGAIGLAAVIVLIALASFILGRVNRERSVDAPGGARPEMVANMAGGNDSASAALSDMGVAPGVGNTAQAQ